MILAGDAWSKPGNIQYIYKKICSFWTSNKNFYKPEGHMEKIKHLYVQTLFSEAFVCLLYLYQCLFGDLLYNEGETVDDTNVKMDFSQDKPEFAATTLIQRLS